MSARTVVSGRYELDALPVAKGGMGEVWFGHDTRLDRPVAVKFVRFPQGEPDAQLIRRFVRESRIAARLEHPGVPAVYDAGVHDGRPFLVMQRIHGISVADLIAELGRLPVGWATAIAAQACAVLAVAHAASLVHRDLKPSNLMLEPDGGVKVLDFGLAMAIDLADFSTITNSGQVLGTPAYMAPEQILGGLSGPASDLYALGCTLHEMLCGEPVFAGSTTYALMDKQVDEEPVAVRTLRPDVPAALGELVLRLLEKKPEDRPASAAEVHERLLPYAVELVPLPGILQPPSAASPVRMYAKVLGRVFGTAAPPAAPPAVPVPRTAPPVSGDLAEARRLIAQSRYSQAADVLGAMVGHAGPDTALRQEYADHPAVTGTAEILAGLRRTDGP
ncbi:Serine/threonine protein kinase [Asanoa hainanensis]|uniref:non-specific serine/threonine protein kinase n=1 Tax=Asanoa hainanensis TaxID=560556 RepID=A0A239LEK1_9ACTN|nr:serine/threonine-protein kinase [Asanoa hainanensis]SNT28362.1 Serine/threonine protein kinase [Asanoa hainanensis]